MTLNSPASNRILWIDFAKMTAILWVIFAHIDIPVLFSRFMWLTPVAVLFFISGYLEKGVKSFRMTALNGFKSVMIPYFLLHTLRYLYWLVVAFWLSPDEYSHLSLQEILLKPALGILIGLGSDTDYSIMLSKQTWFIPALFWVKVIHGLISTVTRNRIDFYILGTCIVVGCVFLLKFVDTRLWFGIDCAILSFPFFALGHLARKTDTLTLLNFHNQLEVIRNIAITLIGFAIIIISFSYYEKPDVNNFHYGADCMLFYILGTISIISTISVSVLYTKQLDAVTTISRGTIIILFAHIMLNNCLCKIVSLLGLEINFLITIIVVIANMFCMIIPIKIVQKYAPILMGRR